VRLPAIALRNLARNRRRTLLSLLMVASGTASLLLTAGFVRFSFDGLENAIVHGGVGHLEVLPESEAASAIAAPERSGPPELTNWEALREEIQRTPGVRGAGGVIHLTGMMSHAQESAVFLALAVEPDRERRMGFDVKVRSGHDLPAEPPGEGEDRVLVGSGLARTLAVRPDDIVTVLAMTSGGSLNAVDMRVAGVFTTGLQELDNRLIKMHLASAQRLIEADGVSSIIVTLADGRQTEAMKGVIARDLAGRPSPLRVLDWRTRAPYYGQVQALYAGIFYFLGGIILVLVGLSTSNTLLTAVMERLREIGTLLALGTSRGQVAALILLEALWLGVLGALAGALLGLGLMGAIHAAGFAMPPPPGAVDPIPLDLTLAPMDVALVVVVMVVVLALSSLLALARTTRLRIVDALGHV
jgi:putative ABC transport system permease protein